MPLWSSSTLMGASVFALNTSFVFFACSIDCALLIPKGALQHPSWLHDAVKSISTMFLASQDPYRDWMPDTGQPKGNIQKRQATLLRPMQSA